IDPALLAPAGDERELARREREIAGAVGRDHAIHDAVELRPAAEIIRVGDEPYVLLRHVLRERERAGADRMGAELVAERLGGLFADDVAAVVVRNAAEKAGVGIFE